MVTDIFEYSYLAFLALLWISVLSNRGFTSFVYNMCVLYCGCRGVNFGKKHLLEFEFGYEIVGKIQLIQATKKSMLKAPLSRGFCTSMFLMMFHFYYIPFLLKYISLFVNE